jgi:hypothetical protein
MRCMALTSPPASRQGTVRVDVPAKLSSNSHYPTRGNTARPTQSVVAKCLDKIKQYPIDLLPYYHILNM